MHCQGASKPDRQSGGNRRHDVMSCWITRCQRDAYYHSFMKSTSVLLQAGMPQHFFACGRILFQAQSSPSVATYSRVYFSSNANRKMHCLQRIVPPIRSVAHFVSGTVTGGIEHVAQRTSPCYEPLNPSKDMVQACLTRDLYLVVELLLLRRLLVRLPEGTEMLRIHDKYRPLHVSTITATRNDNVVLT